MDQFVRVIWSKDHLYIVEFTFFDESRELIIVKYGH